jgi:hypothetical protein
LYASQQSAGKLRLVLRAHSHEKIDPQWLNLCIRVHVRHLIKKKIRENFPEYFV